MGGVGIEKSSETSQFVFEELHLKHPGNPYQNTLLENTDFKKKCNKQNLKCRKTRMSALNYEFLVQPTRMEGKNSYCVVKCVITCVINEQCNRCVFPLLSLLSVVEVLRDNRKKLSLLMRNIEISYLCEERSLCFPLLNSFVPHFA